MKKSKLPSLVSVLILTLVTAVMWVSFNVYRGFVIKPAPAVPKEISEPLTPNLDKNTIDLIETKVFLEESQIPAVSFSQAATPSPTASPTASPTPTPEASPSASPTATP